MRDPVAVALLGAALFSFAGPASAQERCGQIYPHIKDSQLRVATLGQPGDRLLSRLYNTDPSFTARNTTVLVTFWNAANQPIESTCVRLGDVRPGEEVDFEVLKPAGTARISVGAQSTWDR
ncbi:MAG: hypothetical protein HY575_05105 [candidate division NC10 bacterium]|nr:hypothetical protein [candidate division NC10 bacterium]